jgi:hypothetical protein
MQKTNIYCWTNLSRDAGTLPDPEMVAVFPEVGIIGENGGNGSKFPPVGAEAGDDIGEVLKADEDGETDALCSWIWNKKTWQKIEFFDFFEKVSIFDCFIDCSGKRLMVCWKIWGF